MIMDTVGCWPKFISENPKVVKAMADSYFVQHKARLTEEIRAETLRASEAAVS